MPYRLLLVAYLVLAGHCSYAQGQLILAGQVANTTSVTLTPALLLSGQAIYSPTGGGTEQIKLLDIDQDGRDDMAISASGQVAGGYGSHTTHILLKHADAELYSAPASAVGPLCFGLASGDTLQPVMHRRNAAGVLGTWNSGSELHNGITYYNPFALGVVANGALGPYSGGDWLDLQVHYVGFRLRINPTAPWRYGWLRLQVSSKAAPVTLAIQAYALAATPLALLPAHTAGWKLYPTWAADQLTIEPPTSATRGQVTVLDLCGQPVLRATLTGSRQQLNLAGLATGCYLVQLDTPAGHFVQRIAKQ